MHKKAKEEMVDEREGGCALLAKGVYNSLLRECTVNKHLGWRNQTISNKAFDVF
jgi:hypothetical protein